MVSQLRAIGTIAEDFTAAFGCEVRYPLSCMIAPRPLHPQLVIWCPALQLPSCKVLRRTAQISSLLPKSAPEYLMACGVTYV